MKFDGKRKLIILEDGEREVDVRLMYQAWKSWFANIENLIYPVAMRYVGGDKIEDNRRIGITYFLTNGWKIKPYEANHTLVIKGNIYSDDGLFPVVKTEGNYNVLVINKVSNLIDMITTSTSTVINQTVSNASSVNQLEDSSSDDGWTLSQ